MISLQGSRESRETYVANATWQDIKSASYNDKGKSTLHSSIHVVDFVYQVTRVELRGVFT